MSIDDYGKDKILSGSVYHLFADANLADGRGNTREDAYENIKKWLELLAAYDQKYREMRTVADDAMQPKLLEDLKTCLPNVLIDVDKINDEYRRLVDADLFLSQNFFWEKISPLIGTRLLHVVPPSKDFEILYLMIDITAVKVRAVLNRAQYPFYIPLGTPQHQIGYYIISKTELVVTNSGDGLELHAKNAEGLLLTQYHYETQQMDRVIAVALLFAHGITSTTVKKLYAWLHIATKSDCIRYIRPSEVCQTLKLTGDGYKWNPTIKASDPFKPDKPATTESFNYGRAQISGSCSLWSTMFWLYYLIGKNPRWGLTSTTFVQDLRIVVGRHILLTLINERSLISPRMFAMIQIIGRHSVMDDETKKCVTTLTTRFAENNNLLYKVARIEQKSEEKEQILAVIEGTETRNISGILDEIHTYLVIKRNHYNKDLDTFPPDINWLTDLRIECAL